MGRMQSSDRPLLHEFDRGGTGGREVVHQDLHPSEQPPHRFVVGTTVGVGQVLPEGIDERAHRFVAGFGTGQPGVEGLGGLEVSSPGQNVLVRSLDAALAEVA